MVKKTPKLKCDSCNQIVSENLELTHCPLCQSSAVHPEPKSWVEPKKDKKNKHW